MLTSLSLAALSRSGDSSLAAFHNKVEEEKKRGTGDYKHEELPAPGDSTEAPPEGSATPPAPAPSGSE